jgi:hypothetical protein
MDTTMLLLSEPDGQHLRARPCRLRDRLVTRLLASRFDGRLAAGDAPEGDWRLATRAHFLVAPPERHRLARQWAHVLDVAGGRSRRPRRGAPLCGDRITGSESAVRALIAALVVSQPVSVVGVARARLLLTDGTGPLYNQRCSGDLIGALSDITDQLTSPLALVGIA